MVKKYKKAGWKVISISSSHVKMRKGKETEIIPVHKNTDLKKGLERKLLKRLEEVK